MQAQGMAARDPHGAIEMLLAGNLATAELVPERLSPLGEPVPMGPSGLGAFAPLRSGVGPATNPVLDELRRHNVSIPAPPKEVRGVPLTPAEQRQYQVESGRMIDQRVSALMRSQTYQRASPLQQQRMLQRATSLGREQIAAIMLADLQESELKRRRIQAQRQQEEALALAAQGG
jgi:hypothetical protein